MLRTQARDKGQVGAATAVCLLKRGNRISTICTSNRICFFAPSLLRIFPEDLTDFGDVTTTKGLLGLGEGAATTSL
jgi:hypothetical protein